MKNYVFSIFLTVLCIANAQGFEFVINGSFASKPTADKLYLHFASMMGRAAELRSIDVVQGKFSYKGTAEEPQQCILSWGKTPTEDRGNSFSFIVDQGSIKIDIPQGLPSATISGSKTNDELQLYFSFQKQVQPEFDKFNREAQAAGLKSKNTDSLRQVFIPRLEALQEKATREQIKFIKSYPYSFISVLAISEVAKATKNYMQADTLFQSMTAEVRRMPTAKSILEYIEAEKTVSVGAIAPDFEQANANNKMVKLSSLRGKYVLVDFWASWCGPCRQENPNVVNAYNAYKEKGFTILGVSLDKEKGSWLKAVSDDGLTWTQVSDLNYFDNAAAKLYGISAIPSNFLLDDKGKIVARDLRGPELEKVLKKILKVD